MKKFLATFAAVTFFAGNVFAMKPVTIEDQGSFKNGNT